MLQGSLPAHLGSANTVARYCSAIPITNTTTRALMPRALTTSQRHLGTLCATYGNSHDYRSCFTQTQ